MYGLLSFVVVGVAAAAAAVVVVAVVAVVVVGMRHSMDMALIKKEK
jgi:hypothetical protein